MDIKTKKIVNSILFFANKDQNRTINRLKLIKLLWLSDRLHLNTHGRVILKDSYVAMPHGPVPSYTVNFSRQNLPEYFSNPNQYDIKADAVADERFFSKSDLEVMTTIWEKFGDFSNFQLRDLSHKFPEWIRYEKELNDENLPKSYPMVMEDFFEAPKTDDNMDIFNVEGIAETLSQYRVHESIQSNLNGICR